MDIYVDRKGYQRFRKNTKLFHRAIAEEKIGRKSKPWEIVHHINGNKLDNDPTNLEVLDRDEHYEIHFEQKWRSDVW